MPPGENRLTRAAGGVFLLGGVLLFADGAAGSTNSDGSIPANAPAYLRHVQTMVGATIVFLMALMFTWIAFGKGERHFSTTAALPFLAYRSRSAELPGRIAFGIGASLIWAVTIVGIVARRAMTLSTPTRAACRTRAPSWAGCRSPRRARRSRGWAERPAVVCRPRACREVLLPTPRSSRAIRELL